MVASDVVIVLISLIVHVLFFRKVDRTDCHVPVDGCIHRCTIDRYITTNTFKEASGH